MTRKQALTDLLAKVEAGEFDATEDRPAKFNGFCSHWEAARGAYTNPNYKTAWLAYNGSLDAAKALHEAVLPGWGYAVSPQYARVVDPIPLYGSPNKSKDAINADNPARAWLIALLKALIAECDA